MEIDSAGATDTFKWRKDTEDYATGVAITGDDQTLMEGISVNFAVVTGHTGGDYWTQAVDPPYKLNLDSLGAKLVYKNSGGTLIPLEDGDVKADYPVVVIYGATQDCWLLINTADFTTAAEAATDRIRYEKTDNYELVSSDHGNEISFVSASDYTLTLPAAATLANKFFYISANAAGKVTIDADGTEVIKSCRAAAGAGTYIILGGNNNTVQLGTNGVDWHIMTDTRGQVKRTIYTTAGSPHTFTPDPDTVFVIAEVYGGGMQGNLTNGGTGGGGR